MRAVLFLDRSTLHYYGGGLPQVTTLEIPPLALQDMEVIDSAELTRIITEFFQTHKIKPAQTVLCLSSRSYFFRELPAGKTEEEMRTIEDEFVENIPFNKTLCKSFVRGNKRALIGINREVLFTFHTLLRELKHPLLATIPAYPLFGETATPFSKSMGQEILKHFGSLAPISFELHEEAPSTDPFETKTPTSSTKPSNTRLYLLLGLFVILIGILVVVSLLMGKSAKPKTPQEIPFVPASSTNTVPPSLITSPTLSPASPSSELVPTATKNDLLIQIVNGSGTPGEATRIKNRIAEAGFTNSQTDNTTTQVGESTLMIVKPTVSRDMQEEVVTMLKSLGMKVVVRVNNEIESDIRITTYKTPGSPTIQTQVTPTP